MSGIESFMILAGVALNLFAAMACQGSLVLKIDNTKLGLGCVIIAALQTLSLFAGFFLSNRYVIYHSGANEEILGQIIAAVIFFGLAARMIFLGIENRLIEERLNRNLTILRYIRIAGITFLYTVLAGLAFGFLNGPLGLILIMNLILTVLVMVTGMYTGYHYGFEQKTKAYLAGTLLLAVSGVDVILKLLRNY